MNFRKLFNRQQNSGVDPLEDLVLAKLQVGFLLDYDMKSWQVTEYHRYDFDGDIVQEWELTHGNEVRYLERYEDDVEEWTLAKKIPIGMLGETVRRQVVETGEAPAQLSYKDVTYYLESSAAGYMYPNGTGPRQEMIAWEYSDETGGRYLTIEQWSETQLEASESVRVEPYQFSNILPGANV